MSHNAIHPKFGHYVFRDSYKYLISSLAKVSQQSVTSNEGTREVNIVLDGYETFSYILHRHTTAMVPRGTAWEPCFLNTIDAYTLNVAAIHVHACMPIYVSCWNSTW